MAVITRLLNEKTPLAVVGARPAVLQGIGDDLVLQWPQTKDQCRKIRIDLRATDVDEPTNVAEFDE